MCVIWECPGQVFKQRLDISSVGWALGCAVNEGSRLLQCPKQRALDDLGLLQCGQVVLAALCVP